MKCLRCGYCCIKYCVAIVKNPSLGLIESNIILHMGDKPCPHLQGNKPGNYSCLLHNYPWYKDTPCFSHTQIENSDSNCRIGEYILQQEGK